MLFNTLEFLFFFPMVLAAYYLIPHRYRWILLLIASYYFYMCWNYRYIILIAASTLIDYFAALGMGRTPQKPIRRLLLITSLTANLGMLFFFKYFDFFTGSVNSLFAEFNIFYNMPGFDVLLPVGISFYTFQTLSYTIDVYNGKRPPEKHLGVFAVYVSYFPQLVAGPIERSTTLMPQFFEKHKLKYQNIRDGLMLMTWGLFKKVVIADRLAEYVNQVYNNPTDFGGGQSIIATLFFSIQIYCDFSGYSDIAIGLSRMMGIKLMTNFRRPYFAANIREFWQRWHISLSTWFRDYVYIPLGGNRTVKWRWYYNLFITFTVSGLWHGANWTFIIWGALHGIYLLVAIETGPLRKKLNSLLRLDQNPAVFKTLQVLTTFVLVYISWIFFRANSITDAGLIIKNMFNPAYIQAPLNLFHFPIDMALSWIFIGLLIIVDFSQENWSLTQRLARTTRAGKWALYTLLTGTIILLGKFEQVDFLYFQF